MFTNTRCIWHFICMYAYKVFMYPLFVFKGLYPKPTKGTIEELEYIGDREVYRVGGDSNLGISIGIAFTAAILTILGRADNNAYLKSGIKLVMGKGLIPNRHYQAYRRFKGMLCIEDIARVALSGLIESGSVTIDEIYQGVTSTDKAVILETILAGDLELTAKMIIGNTDLEEYVKWQS